MVSIYIPGGEFLMGSAAVDSAAKDDQRPQHPVIVNGFWIDQTEVTNRMYALCVQAGVCQAPVYPGSSTRSNYYGNPDYLDYPVVWVTWSDAQTYCQWAGRRLPTEAEWEKAARGASGSIYPWGDALPDGKHANLCDANCKEKNADASIDDGYGDTSPVGSYPEGASPDQIQDLSGNVWEWVLDWYGADYYTRMVKDSPTGPDAGE
jgi:formylglycine-generating enzyme required for sulfatase activity